MTESSRRKYHSYDPVHRLGIFGGGFDPVHRGHVQLATELTSYAGLDILLVVPGVNPPHKPNGFTASFEHRLKMAALAFEDIPKAVVSDIESTLSGPGYSLHLVQEIKRNYRADEFCLCVGADQFRDLPQWYQPAALAREVIFCVGNRPGETLDSLILPFPVHVEKYHTTLLPISASAIRNNVKGGISESELASLVPLSVAQYILTHGLYCSTR